MPNRLAELDTTQGPITVELFEDLAPVTAANFIDLASRGFYDGLTFHRYVEGFVIQGGDPTGTGTGSSEKTIPLEVSPKLKHDAAGVVAMARSNNPDSASCQFYITLAAQPSLDMNYAVFGRVRSGLENAMKLRKGDRMRKVTISQQD
ncbi:MAG TPA: peptidylprolyl isomerase [Chthonomonadales bacterium]|nr:peptidylprolyl isomerase [Chthonomonadales bacterium]